MAILGAVLALAACALQPAATEPRKALLTQLPTQLPRASPGAAVLLVFPVRSRPLYDTVRMAYTVQPYQVDFFSRHEWAETPAQMLEPLLVKTLRDTHFFGAVVVPPDTGPYQWGLRTEMSELIADFTAEPAVVRLSLRFQLIEAATGRVVATHETTVREPMQQRTPEACVVAANAATAQALPKVARFAVETAH